MNRIFCKTLLQRDQWRNDVIMVVTAGGIISAIEAGTPQMADECIQGIVIPGMPNVHSHAFQRQLAGLSGPWDSRRDSFWSWREAMYRCAQSTGPEQLEAVAAWVFTQMLKSGYTSCGEFHYLHHQPGGDTYPRLAEMSARLVGAAGISGIAMTLLPVLYCRSGFDGAALTPAQRRFVNTPQQYLRLMDDCQQLVNGQPLLALGIAPHSLRAVPVPVLNEVLQSFPDERCPLHIHIAEQPAEVQDCKTHLGSTPLAYLLDECAIDRRWCLVHATHAGKDEMRRAAATGAVVGVCPTTEADLGDGAFASQEWLRTGGHLAIGSDSNVRISVAEELRLLEYNARMRSGERNVLCESGLTCGRFLYQHAASAGGVALGQSVGSLEPGFRADLVELDGQHELLNTRAPDAVMDSWIFAGDRSMIRSVRVAGLRVIYNGRHAREPELRQAFGNVLAGVQQA